MATSGQFDTGARGDSKQHNLQFIWWREAIIDNENGCWSRIYYKVEGRGRPGTVQTDWHACYNIRVTGTINNTTLPNVNDKVQLHDGTKVMEGHFDVPHDHWGNNAVLDVYLTGWIYNGDVSGHERFELDNVDRWVKFNWAYCSAVSVTAATFSWGATDNVKQVNYLIEGQSEQVGQSNIYATSGGFTVYNLKPYTGYSVRLKLLRASNNTWSDWSSPIQIRTKPSAINITYKSRTKNSMTFYAESTTHYYEEQYRINGGDWKWYGWNNQIAWDGSKTKGNFTITGLESAKEYTIQIRGRYDSGAWENSNSWTFWTQATITGNQTPEATRKYNSDQAEINMNINVDWLYWQYKIDNGNWSSNITGSPKKVITGLTPNKTYSFKVRTYKKNYAEWVESDPFTVRTVQKITSTMWLSDLKADTITVNSSASGATSYSTKYRYGVDNSGVWSSWDTKNTFTNLKIKTKYVVQVEHVNAYNNEKSYAYIYPTTKDIARISNIPSTWNINNSITLDIKNEANCTMNLYIVYNNTEIIGRSKITLNNGKYTLTLSETEQNTIRNQTIKESNPVIYFRLKSYNVNYIAADSDKAVSLTDITRAYIKVNGTFRRGTVFYKVNGTWKRCIPYVKINGTWRRS
ncbi:MAG: fibronectin type III domain-containing protein [Clostridium sp.]|nr:fibronectin type III domain-containing protein [Clostridium sp.]